MAAILKEKHARVLWVNCVKIFDKGNLAWKKKAAFQKQKYPLQRMLCSNEGIHVVLNPKIFKVLHF